MTKKLATKKAGAAIEGPPPAVEAGPLRAEFTMDLSSRLRLTLLEPTVDECSQAVALYHATTSAGAPSDEHVTEMRRQVWSLLVGAHTREHAKAPWQPIGEDWRDRLWSESGLSSWRQVLNVWRELFQGAIRIAVAGPPGRR